MIRREDGKIGVFILIFVILIVLTVAGVFIWYESSLNATEKGSDKSSKVTVVIDDGMGISGIAEKLEKEGLIRNATAFMAYCKLKNKTQLMAGKYELDKTMSVAQIVSELENGNIVNDSVTITFIEGKNMRWIAKTIADKTNNSEDDVYNLLSDEEYLKSLIEEYWFITDDILNDEIYYSLEGYLYPDTYTFENADVSVKTIFKSMLDVMDSQLSQYKNEINNSKYDVHELLSLASVVELEALNESDRAMVAGVFYNRLRKNMALQSDVTTYYAVQADMGDRDLTNSDLNTKNAYNTRASNMGGKLPVGPICMVSVSSIKAVVDPDSSSYLFFVADKNGKVYYSETNSEHEELIRELKSKGLWFSY